MTVQAHPLALLLLSSFFFTFFIGALRVLACSVIPGNSPSFQSLFFVVAVAPPPPGEDFEAARTHRAKVGSLWWNLRFDSGSRDEHSEEEKERDIDAIVFFLSLLSLSVFRIILVKTRFGWIWSNPVTRFSFKYSNRCVPYLTRKFKPVEPVHDIQNDRET